MLTKLPFQQVCRAFWRAVTARRPSGPSAAGPAASALPIPALATALAVALLAAGPGRAGVRFENCQGGADGSLTCDTVPTGDTLAEDEEARYGLFQNASPGWNEIDPFAGYEDDFGGNQT
jgi:hypothetical protein